MILGYVVQFLITVTVVKAGLHFHENPEEVNHNFGHFLKRLRDPTPAFFKRRCVDCDPSHPTNIVIRRLRDERGIRTSLQASFLRQQHRQRLTRPNYYNSIRPPFLGTLKIDRHAQSVKGHDSLDIPVYDIAAIAPITTTLPTTPVPKKYVSAFHLNTNPRRMLDTDIKSLVLEDNLSLKLSNESTSEGNYKSAESAGDDNAIGYNSKDSIGRRHGHVSDTKIRDRCIFATSLDEFERKIYNATFTKLVQISPQNRQENGVSFVQSSLFVTLALMTLTMEVDADTKAEIDQCLTFYCTNESRKNIISDVLSSLPRSDDALKFRWSTRLVLGSRQPVSSSPALDQLGLRLDRLNGTDDAESLAKALNHMVGKSKQLKVVEDSGGAMHNTFEEDELSAGLRAALLSVVYIRPRWLAAPTLLNGSRPFHDAGALPRLTRMMKINDQMRYADLDDWDAQALEISYATSGLTLLVIVPRGRSLRSLASRLTSEPLSHITARMTERRVAATLPLYTLRMTLLLPNKLEAVGITRLLDINCTTCSDSLRLSHAVQRLMFWAEAGRNAFKDDGIEWDQAPDLEMVVDRPYAFFVRWHNLTLMSGNFVL